MPYRNPYRPMLICGGRNFEDKLYFETVMREVTHRARRLGILPNVVVTGVAIGADTFGRDWACRNLLPVVDCPYWRHNGPGGGNARNRFMAEFFRPVLTVVFPGGNGTSNMLGHIKRLKLRYAIATQIRPWNTVSNTDPSDLLMFHEPGGNLL